MIESQLRLKEGRQAIWDICILRVIGVHARLVKEKNHRLEHCDIRVSDFGETRQWNCDKDR